MATADEIRQELAREQGSLARERQVSGELMRETREALERQRLRREVDEMRSRVQNVQSSNQWERSFRASVDSDVLGPCTALEAQSKRPKTSKCETFASSSSVVACDHLVYKGEYIWKIANMSWLKRALENCKEDYLFSEGYLEVGPESFDFVYNPHRGWVNQSAGGGLVCASLAIRHCKHDGVTFRYTISIQRNDGEFVQWGSRGDVGLPEGNSTELAFGPDVRVDGTASGIFGLSHDELLQSEWVTRDSLVAKFEIEVLCFCEDIEDLYVNDKKAEVPAPNIGEHFLTLFAEGKCSDVTFLLKTESIKAHSQVLAARSEVFERQFHNGLMESVSKEVTIEDCEPAIFKAFLQFLYTDDVTHIRDVIGRSASACGEIGTDTSSVTETTAANRRVAVLQDMLYLSHKYQVSRLRCWCEQQLCDYLTPEDVCSVIVQAHLCDASQLEEACMKCMRDNMELLASKAEFGKLTAEWPEVWLKASLFCLNVSSGSVSSAAAAAGAALQRKRKRENSE